MNEAYDLVQHLSGARGGVGSRRRGSHSGLAGKHWLVRTRRQQLQEAPAAKQLLRRLCYELWCGTELSCQDSTRGPAPPGCGTLAGPLPPVCLSFPIGTKEGITERSS